MISKFSSRHPIPSDRITSVSVLAGDALEPHAEFIQLYREDAEAIRAELAAGLLAPQAHASPKYLYDALGSRLFEAICELPEYYPTRTEAAIFANHLLEIGRSVGQGATMIDLGAGNCAKAARLFPALQPAQYVPVDISVDFLREAVERWQRKFPALDMVALGMDFSSEFVLPPAVSEHRRLFFYPGSSLGNYAPDEALAFLRRLRQSCDEDGGLLIGIDLVKDAAVLNAAYDDELGLTGAFNLNLLLHLNAMLGADFEPRQWRHVAFFNPDESRIEMHLEARQDLAVQWRDGRRRFAAGERIHTENSYKYTRDRFLSLLHQAGFGAARTWTDERGWFMVCHARAI
ncbi:dimethylhistidine N-methyltransferase [Noviherbaspirillum humi]|uniref:Dimethylhistidine N-methyltransferase n=1 Tax=Noviherbaspirillum humi TaxID=1688639 RepID=A0A239DFQ2_9BURK|nr:L-histidine N(alpha)-methyltransferase [Noviherbaspirillum humi]SNS30711.1 dimethylhistidine N-methyltransferase [Noviherbaspirillum humi]